MCLLASAQQPFTSLEASYASSNQGPTCLASEIQQAWANQFRILNTVGFRKIMCVNHGASHPLGFWGDTQNNKI